jgi:hypothetical protein
MVLVELVELHRFLRKKKKQEKPSSSAQFVQFCIEFKIIMPSSKRAKEVVLSKTGKKEKKTAKDKVIDSIRECIQTFSHVYVFGIHNIRSNFMSQIRHHFLTSRYSFYSI